MAYCHKNTHHKKGDQVKGWAFTGVTSDGRCGVFVPHKPLSKPQKGETQFFEYGPNHRIKRYYREGKNDRAYLHIMIHKELGGAEGDAILIGIEKRKAAEPAKASQPRDAEKDSQPAGAGKSGE